MKVLHGIWSCSFKQINKGTINVFDTPYIRVLQVFFHRMISMMGLLQTKWIIKAIWSSKSILDAFNACCI
jgi:hypothetical protein